MRVVLGTIGCKLNQAETERLTRELLEAGHVIVDPEGAADVYILNTCTVTRTADAKCRAWLGQAYRLHPDARLVVTGCYAQRMPEDFVRMHGICLVAGNNLKPDLLSLLGAADNLTASIPENVTPPPRRTRSFIKFRMGAIEAVPIVSCRWCGVAKKAALREILSMK